MADEPDIAEGGEGTDVALTDLLEQLLVLTLQAMAGPVYGKVDVYNSVKNRVSITPLVPLLVAGEIVTSPKLPEVPVAWPTLGSMSLKFPLLPGSKMLLTPLGHDHSSWLVSGTEGLAPLNERRFSLSDLVAVPLTPSPLSTPPGPTSYDDAWAVLFGKLKVGSSAATKAAALHLDAVNKDATSPALDFASWMASVDAGLLGVPFTVVPSAASITKIGLVQATATKLKAE